MPCRDYNDDVQVRYERNPNDIRRLDEYARRLCTVMSKFEEVNPKEYKALDKATRNWHRKHKEDDAKEQERLRLAAEALKYNFIQDAEESEKLGKIVLVCSNTGQKKILD